MGSALQEGSARSDATQPGPGAAAIGFAANYYDGNSSRVHPVRATVVAGMLVTQGEDGKVMRRDPVAALLISPQLGLTVRSIRLSDGAKLETDDHVAIDALERQRGTGGAHRVLHRIETNWRVTAASVVVMVAIATAGFYWGVPALARRAALAMPDALAYDLGRGTLSMLDRAWFKPTELTPARRAELEAKFAELAAYYPHTPLRLVFRRAMPNAFALPDGTIIVTDELVALAEHDDEILAVVAHEIGHVHERHALRMAIENSVVALLAFTYIGDATQASALVASLPTVLANGHFSRTHELEADSFASGLLKRASIPLHRFADILRRLDREVPGASESMNDYFSSHPGTEERARRFVNSASR